MYTLPKFYQIDQVCVTNDDRPEQEAMVYTVTRRENIYIQPVLEPEYGNVPMNTRKTRHIFLIFIAYTYLYTRFNIHTLELF